MQKLCWPAAIVIGALGYVLSSGPVIAGAIHVAKSTGIDAIGGVILLYYPLLENSDTAARYVEWCLIVTDVGWQCC